jgi:hypothetical protein
MPTTETGRQLRTSLWTSLNLWIKKIHMYTGLLTFSIPFVFGIAGLTATFQASPEERQRHATERLLPFTAPPNATDSEVAAAVHAALRPPLTQPPPKFALRRDAARNLAFSFYTPNGIIGVTVLEEERQLRIRALPNSTGGFLNALHETTIQNPMAKRDLRIRLWTWYNEFAIWSLLAMALSGVYLWLSSRPRFRWAQLAFAGGCMAFLTLYAVTR